MTDSDKQGRSQTGGASVNERGGWTRPVGGDAGDGVPESCAFDHRLRAAVRETPVGRLPSYASLRERLARGRRDRRFRWGPIWVGGAAAMTIAGLLVVTLVPTPMVPRDSEVSEFTVRFGYEDLSFDADRRYVRIISDSNLQLRPLVDRLGARVELGPGDMNDYLLSAPVTVNADQWLSSLRASQGVLLAEPVER